MPVSVLLAFDKTDFLKRIHRKSSLIQSNVWIETRFPLKTQRYNIFTQPVALQIPSTKTVYQVLPLTKTFLATKIRMNHIQFKTEFRFSMFPLRRITV
jgi:hypothetical protein